MMDLSISIVNYNTKDLLTESIGSIYSATKDIDFEMIVVDNNSTDGSAGMVECDFPKVVLIKNESNPGFARANNQAFSISRGRYFLILNPDTLVLDGALEKMVRFLDSNADGGAVGPRFLNEDNSLQRAYRRFPTVSRMVFTATFLNKLFPNNGFSREYLYQDCDFQQICTVETLGGSCFMLRKSILGQRQLMDEHFPLFFNDVDLSHRIQDLGYKIYMIPEARIIHYRGKSTQQAYGPMMLAESAISMMRYFRKYESRFKVYILKVIFSVEYFLRFFRIVLAVIFFKKSVVELKAFFSLYPRILFEKSTFQENLNND